MGISLNPISIIIKGIVRIIEAIVKYISYFKCSCCASECEAKNMDKNIDEK